MSRAYCLLKEAYIEYKQNKKLPWKIRLMLLFKQRYVAFDWAGSFDWNTNSAQGKGIVFYKYLNGNVYIVGEESFPKFYSSGETFMQMFRRRGLKYETWNRLPVSSR